MAAEPKRDDAPLTALHHLEYTYRRSVGPVLGRFFAGLRERRIEGVRTRAGRVLVPPAEYDPETGEATSDEFVPVGPPRFARYDAPFKPWFLRRNEVVQDVFRPHEGQGG